MKLADVFTVDRRYSRSVNLERDMRSAASLAGYILSDRNYAHLARILTRTCVHNQPRAWTVTGLYGTGKSAFANVILGLFGDSDSPTHTVALQTVKSQPNYDARLFKMFRSRVGSRGLVRAAATAAREPLVNTVIRALNNGVTEFWESAKGARPAAYHEVLRTYGQVERGTKVPQERALTLLREVAVASRSGVILIIDELGKCLEHAADNVQEDGLYLLQQLAELPAEKTAPIIYTVGILHQAFTEYAQVLPNTQQREWAKVQGRFEDVPFYESPTYVTKLLGRAISCNARASFARNVKQQASDWHRHLQRHTLFSELSAKDCAALYPLHPIAAVVLPYLAERFAQNDRSIFSFLTSDEPLSFKTFLETQEAGPDRLVSVKVHDLYDYFVESLGMGMTSHHLFQRWTEIQSAVADAEAYGADHQRMLKTIGILNLISSAASCKATPEIALYAMVDDPDELSLTDWKRVISDLTSKGVITHRKQVNELRIWHGTDFDIEAAVQRQLGHSKTASAELMRRYWQLAPIVASRHSYRTGTLRYFDRRFFDIESMAGVQQLLDTEADGVLFYWLDDSVPPIDLLAEQPTPKPIVVLAPQAHAKLRDAINGFVALNKVLEHSPEIRTDGVARKELAYRLRLAKDILDSALQQAFRMDQVKCSALLSGHTAQRGQEMSLSALCTGLCDQAYSASPILANELINRRTLSSQAAKARRQLMAYMVENEGLPQLGIDGYGPERSMFESVFAATGIYRERKGKLTFGSPYEQSGVAQIWTAIEQYCLAAHQGPRDLKALYATLQRPPYGMRSELIPLLLIGVLLEHSEDVVLYYEGSFVPVLAASNLELLLKHPDRFAVAYFEMTGLRKRLFDKLESVLQVSTRRSAQGVRNPSLLGVLKPLIRFIRELPQYTIHASGLSDHAKAVREVLVSGRHPDRMVFEQLPEACGLPTIDTGEDALPALEEFKVRFSQTLHELYTAYDALLTRNQEKLCRAFSITNSPGRLREHLRVRSSSLLAITVEPRLRQFLTAAVEAGDDERRWLESVSMVIADKPVRSWSDDDERTFDVQINEVARRYMNLEALDKAMGARFERAYDARRVIVTKPDGTERQRVLWIEQDTKSAIQGIVDGLIATHPALGEPEVLQSVIAVLLDQLLAIPDAASASTDGKREKVKKLNG